MITVITQPFDRYNAGICTPIPFVYVGTYLTESHSDSDCACAQGSATVADGRLDQASICPRNTPAHTFVPSLSLADTTHYQEASTKEP